MEMVRMEYEAELQSLTHSLGTAQDILQRAAAAYPGLQTVSRARRRISMAANRPLRLAILGETNSGKSSLANLLAGHMTLPALPVANTRLPTLLHYAPVPFAAALHANGKRFALSAGKDTPPETIIRLEVGLPDKTLRQVEILDFPGSANPLLPTALSAVLQHGASAAIWATVATQAWRETERAAWLGLPQKIRSRGLLVVTHCDLITNQEDFRRLRARLESAAKPHFQGMCFLAAPPGNRPGGAAEAGAATGLLAEVRRLARQFSADRLGKAVLITRRLAAQTLARLDTGAKD